jgi:hypothetical protein
MIFRLTSPNETHTLDDHVPRRREPNRIANYTRRVHLIGAMLRFTAEETAKIAGGIFRAAVG